VAYVCLQRTLRDVRRQMQAAPDLCKRKEFGGESAGVIYEALKCVGLRVHGPHDFVQRPRATDGFGGNLSQVLTYALRQIVRLLRKPGEELDFREGGAQIVMDVLWKTLCAISILHGKSSHSPFLTKLPTLPPAQLRANCPSLRMSASSPAISAYIPIAPPVGARNGNDDSRTSRSRWRLVQAFTAGHTPNPGWRCCQSPRIWHSIHQL